MQHRIEELQVQLEHEQFQQPSPAPIEQTEQGWERNELCVAKPRVFKGDYKGQQVLCWLAQIKTAIAAQEYNGPPLTEDRKVTIATSYLDDTPRTQYDAYIERNSEFKTYEDFKQWITKSYSPADYSLYYKQEYKRIQQYENEAMTDFNYDSTSLSTSYLNDLTR